MRLAAFLMILLALTPVMMIGMLFYMMPILRTRGRVSGTAYEPFISRLIAHLVDTRPDPASARLAKKLPATNRFSMALLVRPLVWACRLSGYTPEILRIPVDPPYGMLDVVSARTEFFDQAMLEGVVDGDQVVILGAGWDTRAYQLLQNVDVRFFEVDTASTQDVKRSAVQRTGIDDSRVTFVPCDFEKQGWLDVLRSREFRCDRRTFVLWEGVSMYLDERAVDQTLRSVASLPAGSAIAMDFFSRHWLKSALWGRLIRWGLGAIYGEWIKFGFPTTPDYPRPITDYFNDRGLVVEKLRPIGAKSPDQAPPYGTILARRVETSTST